MVTKQLGWQPATIHPLNCYSTQIRFQYISLNIHISIHVTLFLKPELDLFGLRENDTSGSKYSCVRSTSGQVGLGSFFTLFLQADSSNPAFLQIQSQQPEIHHIKITRFIYLEHSNFFKVDSAFFNCSNYPISHSCTLFQNDVSFFFNFLRWIINT